MSQNKPSTDRTINRSWLSLLPILLMAPLAMAPKGCGAAVVGDDCPEGMECTGSAGNAGSEPGSAGKPGTAGSTGTAGSSGTGDVCGGLLGTACDKGEYCDFAPETQCGSGDQTGTCKLPPDACDTSYSPVCGCNGKTYGNSCSAASNGVSVASKGECVSTQPGKTCGGIQGVQCDKGEYCEFDPSTKCGDGDQTGTCKVPPQVCTDHVDPVCGCDGKTYSNSCEAAAKGVSVLSAGACGSDPGTACGGLKGIACDKGFYCNFPPEASCGNADQSGTCTVIPSGACDASYVPVCGCDGKTYGNACSASLAGMSIAKKGECATGKVCGGLLGLTCDKAEYCNYSLEAACGSGDMQGKCEAKPTACTKEQNIVCGCDGTTYGNPCMAAAAGTSVSPGKCK